MRKHIRVRATKFGPSRALVLQYTDPFTHRRVVRSTGQRDWAIAKQMAAELEAEVNEKSLTGIVSIGAVANAFIKTKRLEADQERIKRTTLRQYEDAVRALMEHFGTDRSLLSIKASDFSSLRDSLASRFAPCVVTSKVVCIRMVFKFAFDLGLIIRPMDFGSEFRVCKPRKINMAAEMSQIMRRLAKHEERGF